MMNEAIQTMIAITIAISSVFAVGFCVVNLAAKRLRISGTSEQLWAATPLVGAGTIILVCQNLLYLDVRIPYSAILIWVSVALVAIASVARNRFSISSIPWSLIATGVAIYIIHASGLLGLGVSNYYGYGWADMFNYVSMAQFFIDFPFSATANTQEYVYVANHYKSDRIGQSVLHAFIASSAGVDAQQAFGATILLSPMLIFFSIFLLSTSLGIERRFAYPAAIVASLSPAIASVHLECFFSQAMAMPFLFLWPLAVSLLRSHPGVRSSLVAGLLFAVTSAIYTEVTPPLTLITAIVLFAFYWRKGGNSVASSKIAWIKRSWKALFSTLLSLGFVLVVGACANMGYFKGAIAVMGRTTGTGVLDVLYPWAFKSEGLARLWVGHQFPLLSRWLLYCLAFASIIVILAAIAYTLSLCRRNATPSRVFSVLVACMPLAPLLLSILTRNKYPYQFFKLLLMVWPLILFFATCGIGEWISRRRERGLLYFQVAFVCVSIGLTNRIALASTKPETVSNTQRGGAHLLIDENFKQMRAVLDGLEGKQVYIWWYDRALWDGTWRGRWLAYYARKNVVWSVRKINLPGVMLESLPASARKVPAIGISWKKVSAGNMKKIGSSLAGTDPFWLYQLTDDDEVYRLDQASREYGVYNRSMQLSVNKDADPDTWYPLWVVGQPGSATLVTVNFGKSKVRFRYDQWGRHAVSMEPGGACSGTELLVSVRVEQFKQKVTVNCNGEVAQNDMPNGEAYLSLKDPLGVNHVTNNLEGKYPLAKFFHGTIVEQPIPD